MTFLPITRCRYTVPAIVGLCFAVAIAQTIFGNPESIGAIWCNVGASALIATCLWDIIDRYHLVRNRSKLTFMFAFVSLTAATGFPLQFMPASITPAMESRHGALPSWLLLLALGGQLLCLALMLRTWQRRHAPLAYLSIGLIIGLLSTLHPHFLFWLLLLPAAFYQMRSFSWRNLWSTVSGIILSAWIVYAVTFLMADETSADKVLLSYTKLAAFDLPDLRDMGLWALLYFALFSVPATFLAIAGILPGSGDSVRTHSSMALISALIFTLLAFSFVDGALLPVHIGLIALFLATQFSILISHWQNAVYEWWVTFILLAMLALGVAPFFLS